MKTRLPKQSGFTLLEVLVSIAVFSMVALVSYSTLDTYIDHRERLNTHYGKLDRLQRMFILLERDIQFAVNRRVRIGGDTEAAIKSSDGDELISLTVATADIENPTGVALKRAQWRLEGTEMIRAEWAVLDHTGNIEATELVISDEIEELELTYLFYDDQGGLDTKSSLDDDDYPQGVEVIIKLVSGEQYRRVFGVSGGA